MLNNTITSSSTYHGIVVENGSTVTCNQNTVTKQYPNTGTGIGIAFSGGGTGNLWQNDVSGWWWGVCAIWGSSPQFAGANNNGRNNRIRYCTYGVQVYNNSYPLICPQLADDFTYYWGNTISNNTKNIGLNIYYSTVSELTEQLTYWGAYPPTPSMFEVGSGSSVDYENALDYDPWDGYGLMAGGGGDQPTQSASIAMSPSAQPSEEAKESIYHGIALRLQNKYQEAKEFFKAFLAKYPASQAAYVELYNCYNEQTAEDITNFFISLPKEASKEHQLLLGYLYLKQGKIELAKQLNDGLIQDNPNTPLAIRAKLNNFYIALYHENNVEQASTLLDEVSSKAQFTTEIELSLARQAFENFGTKNIPAAQGSAIAQSALSAEKEQEPSSQSLEIYPNPFNPVTTLRYGIEDDAIVTLKIYDMLGREVAVLADGFVVKGPHSATWDASSSPSGIYFARLQTAGSVSVKKLMVVK